MRSCSADETTNAQYVGPSESTNTESGVFCKTSPSRHIGRSTTRWDDSRSARITVALRLLPGHETGSRSGIRVTIASSGAIHRVMEASGSKAVTSLAWPAHELPLHLSVWDCTRVNVVFVKMTKANSRLGTDMIWTIESGA